MAGSSAPRSFPAVLQEGPPCWLATKVQGPASTPRAHTLQPCLLPLHISWSRVCRLGTARPGSQAQNRGQDSDGRSIKINKLQVSWLRSCTYKMFRLSRSREQRQNPAFMLLCHPDPAPTPGPRFPLGWLADTPKTALGAEAVSDTGPTPVRQAPERTVCSPRASTPFQSQLLLPGVTWLQGLGSQGTSDSTLLTSSRSGGQGRAGRGRGRQGECQPISRRQACIARLPRTGPGGHPTFASRAAGPAGSPRQLQIQPCLRTCSQQSSHPPASPCPPA